MINDNGKIIKKLNQIKFLLTEKNIIFYKRKKPKLLVLK